MKRKVPLMIVAILLLQIILPMVSIMFESGLTLISRAEGEITSGDWIYTVNDDGNTITITDYTGSATELTIPSTIDGYNVTSIGKAAFISRSQLKSIIIPDSVINIGDSAFSYCYSLTSIEIPEGVISIGSSVFYNCNSLTSIVLPDSLINIGNSAFHNCNNLTSIEIPKGVKSIGAYAFYNCNNLTSIIVHEENEYYSSENGVLYNKDKTERIYPKEITSGDWKYEFNEDESSITIVKYNGTDSEVIVPSKIDDYNVTGVGKIYSLYSSLYNSVFTDNTTVTEVTIPEGIKYIGNSAFRNCTNLKKISIPNTVDTIETYAFYNCNNLSSIVLPPNLTRIRRGLFEDCTNLTTVTIPEEVIYIEESAFKNCNISSISLPEKLLKMANTAFNGCALKTITLPRDVEIGDFGYTYAFTDCSELEEINVSEDNQNYCSDNGVLFNKSKTELMAYPIGNKQQNYTIPSSVQNIAEYAFYNCSNLSSISIPEGVKDIGKSTFEGCSNLTDIILPDSVQNLGGRAFANCTNLESVKLSNELVELPMACFYGCSKLANVELGQQLKIIELDAFRDCYNLTSIELPDTLEEIKFQAFCSTKLKNIIIPKNVKNIEDNVFNSCNYLISIDVEEDNQNYSSENGVLFDKDKKILMEYPDNKPETMYETPKSVTTIAHGAFNQCSNLQIIKLSDGITTIEDWAFANSSIKDFKIPKNCGDVLGNRTFSGSAIENVISYKTLNESVIRRINFSSPFDSISPYTLWGLKNSHAEEYAANNNIKFDYLQLDSIRITKEPLKTKYNVGETFNSEGMIVTATFIYDTNKTIEYDIDESDYTISSNGLLSTEDSEITISYTEDGTTKTTAQAITVESKTETILKGDVNADNVVDFMDILAINKHRLGKTQLIGECLTAADVNEDGNVDFMDILQINKYRLEKIDSL